MKAFLISSLLLSCVLAQELVPVSVGDSASEFTSGLFCGIGSLPAEEGDDPVEVYARASGRNAIISSVVDGKDLGEAKDAGFGRNIQDCVVNPNGDTLIVSDNQGNIRYMAITPTGLGDPPAENTYKGLLNTQRMAIEPKTNRLFIVSTNQDAIDAVSGYDGDSPEGLGPTLDDLLFRTGTVLRPRFLAMTTKSDTDDSPVVVGIRSNGAVTILVGTAASPIDVTENFNGQTGYWDAASNRAAILNQIAENQEEARPESWHASIIDPIALDEVRTAQLDTSFINPKAITMSEDFVHVIGLDKEDGDEAARTHIQSFSRDDMIALGPMYQFNPDSLVGVAADATTVDVTSVVWETWAVHNGNVIVQSLSGHWIRFSEPNGAAEFWRSVAVYSLITVGAAGLIFGLYWGNKAGKFDNIKEKFSDEA